MQLRPKILKSEDEVQIVCTFCRTTLYVAQFLRKRLELLNDKFFIYSFRTVVRNQIKKGCWANMDILILIHFYSYCTYMLARFIIEMCCEGSRLQQLPHNNDHNCKNNDENLHSGGGTAAAAGGHVVFSRNLVKTCFWTLRILASPRNFRVTMSVMNFLDIAVCKLKIINPQFLFFEIFCSILRFAITPQ